MCCNLRQAGPDALPAGASLSACNPCGPQPALLCVFAWRMSVAAWAKRGWLGALITAHPFAHRSRPPWFQCPAVSGLEGIRSARHRLDSTGSPLLRALPDYQRQFQEHLLQATARHEASQQRCAGAALCRLCRPGLHGSRRRRGV